MTDLNPIIADRFTEHLEVFGKTMEHMDTIQEIAYRCKAALENGNKILFCGRTGDVLIGISTSGNSKNVVKAAEMARSIGMHTIAFTGEDGGKLAELCDITLAIPSNVTARIQEMHILAGHIMCEIIEEDY